MITGPELAVAGCAALCCGAGAVTVVALRKAVSHAVWNRYTVTASLTFGPQKEPQRQERAAESKSVPSAGASPYANDVHTRIPRGEHGRFAPATEIRKAS